MGFSEAFAHIFKLVFGWLSARVSFRKWLVAGGYAVEGFFMACIGLASFGWQIVGFRAISRIGKGMRSPARDAMLAASVDEADYGAGFGMQRTSDTLGAVVGIALLFWLVPYVSDRYVFYFALLPALMASASILFWAHDPRGDLPLTHDWRILPDIWKLPRSFWRFLIIVACFGIAKVHAVVLLLQQHNVATANGLLVSRYVMLVYLCYNIARAVQGFSAGKVGDWYGREKTLALGGYALFGLATLLMSIDAPHLWMSIPLFVLLGVSDATVLTLEKSMVAQIVEPYLRDVGYGVLFLIKGFAMLCAGWIVGSLWSIYSSLTAFGYIFAMSMIAAMLLWVSSYWKIYRNSTEHTSA